MAIENQPFLLHHHFVVARRASGGDGL